MKTLIFCSNYGIEKVIKRNACIFSHFIIDCTNEWEVFDLDFLKSYPKVKVSWITGAYIDKDFFDPLYFNFNYLLETKQLTVKSFMNFFFYVTRLTKEDKSSYFSFPYTSLLNRDHTHRRIFIDLLTKYNVLNKGFVTWNDPKIDLPVYKFRYFDGKPIYQNGGRYKNQWVLPLEYSSSFFDIVTESTHHNFFVTEKTCKPLFLGKPFIVLGCKDYHKNLKKFFNIELYDEIIDYSFDSVMPLYERTDLFVKEVDKICNLDINKSLKLIKEKIDYNQNRCKEIILNYKYRKSKWLKKEFNISKKNCMMLSATSIIPFNYLHFK